MLNLSQNHFSSHTDSAKSTAALSVMLLYSSVVFAKCLMSARSSQVDQINICLNSYFKSQLQVYYVTNQTSQDVVETFVTPTQTRSSVPFVSRSSCIHSRQNPKSMLHRLARPQPPSNEQEDLGRNVRVIFLAQNKILSLNGDGTLAIPFYGPFDLFYACNAMIDSFFDLNLGLNKPL